MKNNPKREKIFNFIHDYVQTNNYPPSIREICKALNISSTATVAYNIDKLKDEGRLSKTSFKNRTLSVSSTKPETVSIPLVGQVAAGIPILATEHIEDTFIFPKTMFRGDNLFMLRVKGDSMIDAGIFDGDKIIVRQQNSADRGQIVVALVGDEATVKRYYPENGHIRLQPENSTMDPIIVPSCQVLGLVIGSIRNF